MALYNSRYSTDCPSLNCLIGLCSSAKALMPNCQIRRRTQQRRASSGARPAGLPSSPLARRARTRRARRTGSARACQYCRPCRTLRRGWDTCSASPSVRPTCDGQRTTALRSFAICRRSCLSALTQCLMLNQATAFPFLDRHLAFCICVRMQHVMVAVLHVKCYFGPAFGSAVYLHEAENVRNPYRKTCLPAQAWGW